MTPAVDVAGLSHAYGDRRALDGLSLRVEEGARFGLLGPNGSGKSTLFRLLATLVRPRSGSVRLFGVDAGADPAAARRLLGVVFQAPALDARLTVRENLRVHGHLYGLSGAALRSREAEMLGLLRLEDRAGDYVSTLSGGLKRRVELAKGLLHRPRLLLLDEPTTGLDPGARRDLWNHVFGLDGVTVLFTTHLLEEADRCSRIAILERGKIVAEGAPDALKAEIPGDVVTVATADPAALAREISERLGVKAAVSGDRVRIESAGGHELAAKLAAEFGARVASVTVGRPTLDDVYARRTGRSMEEAA